MTSSLTYWHRFNVPYNIIFTSCAGWETLETYIKVLQEKEVAGKKIIMFFIIFNKTKRKNSSRTTFFSFLSSQLATRRENNLVWPRSNDVKTLKQRRNNAALFWRCVRTRIGTIVYMEGLICLDVFLLFIYSGKATSSLDLESQSTKQNFLTFGKNGKGKSGGVSFYWISTVYSQKYTPTHCLFLQFCIFWVDTEYGTNHGISHSIVFMVYKGDP